MNSLFGIENLTIFIDGTELVDFRTAETVKFEYSKNLSDWQSVTVPVDTGNYFLRIKNTD